MPSKREITRPYTPLWVSRESAAYLLDISPSQVDVLVRANLLPEPARIGNNVRWRFADIEAIADNRAAIEAAAADPALEGIRRVTQTDDRSA